MQVVLNNGLHMTSRSVADYFCSDGCARTGTFIAISHTLERIKVEGTLDIFQALKSSRIHRPGLVANVVSTVWSNPTIVSYLFCRSNTNFVMKW